MNFFFYIHNTIKLSLTKYIFARAAFLWSCYSLTRSSRASGLMDSRGFGLTDSLALGLFVVPSTASASCIVTRLFSLFYFVFPHLVWGSEGSGSQLVLFLSNCLLVYVGGPRPDANVVLGKSLGTPVLGNIRHARALCVCVRVQVSAPPPPWELGQP